MTVGLGLLNVDFHPLAKGVIACDVCRGLAFPAARLRKPDSLFMETLQAAPGAAASGHH